jgi:hypothetical protein
MFILQIAIGVFLGIIAIAFWPIALTLLFAAFALYLLINFPETVILIISLLVALGLFQLLFLWSTNFVAYLLKAAASLLTKIASALPSGFTTGLKTWDAKIRGGKSRKEFIRGHFVNVYFLIIGCGFLVVILTGGR